MDKDDFGIILAMFLCVLLGVFLGTALTGGRAESTAIDAGVARYDAKTAAFEFIPVAEIAAGAEDK